MQIPNPLKEHGIEDPFVLCELGIGPYLGFGVWDLGFLIAPSDPKTKTSLALLRRHRERTSLHILLPAVQSKLALLDCANPVNRGRLVLGRRIKAAMAPKSVAGVCRRHCLFHRDVQLARRAWRFVSKLFSPQPFVSVVDLSCGSLRLLGMGHRISATTNVHRLMAKSADRVYRSVRVGYARVGPRLAV